MTTGSSEIGKFVGGDQSPVGEINLTHKLPEERARGKGGCAETVGPREGSSYLPRGMLVRKRGRNERRPRCSPYQDLFASLPSEERMGGMREGGARRVHGGAYLRVIPEGRAPSAWDPADNVPPLRAIPPAYTGCRSCRIDCTLRRDVPGKNVKVARIEPGVLKGVLPQASEHVLIRRPLSKLCRAITCSAEDIFFRLI